MAILFQAKFLFKKKKKANERIIYFKKSCVKFYHIYYIFLPDFNFHSGQNNELINSALR